MDQLSLRAATHSLSTIPSSETASSPSINAIIADLSERSTLDQIVENMPEFSSAEAESHYNALFSSGMLQRALAKCVCFTNVANVSVRRSTAKAKDLRLRDPLHFHPRRRDGKSKWKQKYDSFARTERAAAEALRRADEGEQATETFAQAEEVAARVLAAALAD